MAALSVPGANDARGATGARGAAGRRFSRWLEARIPPSRSITLSQRNIFIFPTRTGFVFAALLVLLILGAINYQASLVYGMAFLLGSLFLVTILYTFRNLSGLALALVEQRSAFVGEDMPFVIRVTRPGNSPREGVQLGWPDTVRQWATLYDKASDEVVIFVRATRRGYLDPGRLLIETHYPLGLLRAWTWVDLQAEGLVYPKPIFAPYPQQQRSRRQDGTLIDPVGSEDLTDLRSYQPGDPIRHILWRSYARSDELVVKNYASYVEPRLHFDLEALPGDLEERLSRLAGLALTASREGREFGARVGPQSFAPNVGDAHLEAVLRALALYGAPARASAASGDAP
ncbi:MAG: DUF58 domain-containing protein [Pseudomonadota bacterium]